MTGQSSRKHVVITGAAGGLGTAIATHLAHKGHSLILTDQKDCAALAANLGDAVVHHQPCDLADAAAVDAFIADVRRRADVDVLINNAAVLRQVPLSDLDHQDLRLFHRVNVEANFQLTSAFTQDMRERGWGRVVNITSSQTWAPEPGFLSYVSSKMAITGISRALARELGNNGITVNCIAPSAMLTHDNKDALPQEVWDMIKAQRSIKRTSTPEDVVGAIAFLISDDASFITGQSLVIDGGVVFT